MIYDGDVKRGDALLIVDVQVDFCPGGALGIDAADQILPELNRWIQFCGEHSLPVFASRDWHPKHHISFHQEGGPWPAHCIQDTRGAQFHEDLRLPPETVVVTKGVRFDQDQYSAFDQTGLEVHMKRVGIRRIFIAGLALDVCVRATALDARKHGMDVTLITKASMPVDPNSTEQTMSRLTAAGVILY